MKSDPPPKKGRASAGRQPTPDPRGSAGGAAGPQDDASAQATPQHGVTGEAKENRRNPKKQTKPPVRIVSDLPPKREIVPRGKQTHIANEAEEESIAPDDISPGRIAERAYELYQAGGYEPGREVEHWLEAERQLRAEQRARRSR